MGVVQPSKIPESLLIIPISSVLVPNTIYHTSFSAKYHLTKDTMTFSLDKVLVTLTEEESFDYSPDTAFHSRHEKFYTRQFGDSLPACAEDTAVPASLVSKSVEFTTRVNQDKKQKPWKLALTIFKAAHANVDSSNDTKSLERRDSRGEEIKWF